jgi:hypothetical protein
MPHEQQKGSRNDKSGKEQKDMPKKGTGQEMQKNQTEQQRKDEPSRMEQNR